MKSLRFTLRADGTSDDMLMPVVRWVICQHLPIDVAVNGQFAMWFGYRGSSQKGLAESIKLSVDLAPCDLLIVHRDVEKESRKSRVEEINKSLEQLKSAATQLPECVRLVPTRMSEAWLLFDEQAIRSAAGNPNGKVPLLLPKLATVEDIADPKETLRDLLAIASELSGRRLKKFQTGGLPRVVAHYIEDFSPLRRLKSFQEFEEEIKAFLQSRVWEE